MEKPKKRPAQRKTQTIHVRSGLVAAPKEHAGCRGRCELVKWEATFDPFADIAVQKDDDDCPELDESLLTDLAQGAVTYWVQKNSDGEPRGCDGDCECHFPPEATYQVVAEIDRVIERRYAKPVLIDGHRHFCRYTIGVVVHLKKLRVTGECVPSNRPLEVPEVIGPI